MGITRIDFGNDVEIASSNGAALDTGTWVAEVVSAEYKVAKTGNVGIEVKYKVTDEKAKDVEGEPFTRHVWDSVWFSAKSLKMTKIKLKGLGVDVDTLIVESEEDVQDLAAELLDTRGQEVKLVTEAIVDTYKTERNEDGETVYKTNVKFVNSL